MKLKHYLIYFVSVGIMISALSWFLYFQKSDKEIINLEFVEKERFKINEVIEPLSLIKTTSTANIVYPKKIDTSTPGEKQLIYIAIDENGAQKEFIKTINVYSPQPPVLKLKQVDLSIYIDDAFNPLSYVKEAYDPYDGELQVNVSDSYNLKKSGTYTVIYSIENSSGLKSQAKLALTVKEKTQPVQPPKNVPVTGTNKETPINKKPASIQRLWKFQDGYDFNSAKAACMKAAEALNVRYTCDVVYEGEIAVGYQLIY